MATGLLRHFTLCNISIPQELSLLGMDDIELATMVTPSLSTIHQPLRELAQTAIEIIMKYRVDEAASIPSYYSIDPFLVVRESSAPPPTQ